LEPVLPFPVILELFYSVIFEHVTHRNQNVPVRKKAIQISALDRQFPDVEIVLREMFNFLRCRISHNHAPFSSRNRMYTVYTTQVTVSISSESSRESNSCFRQRCILATCLRNNNAESIKIDWVDQD
jgi:hypothetical protein